MCVRALHLTDGVVASALADGVSVLHILPSAASGEFRSTVQNNVFNFMCIEHNNALGNCQSLSFFSVVLCQHNCATRQYHPVPAVRRYRTAAALRWCSPLLRRRVSGAGLAVPGAVGVAGQAAVCTHLSVDVAAVERQVGHAEHRAHVQLLLPGKKPKTKPHAHVKVILLDCL